MRTKKVQIIDSHTGGEPTRVVVGGGPDLGAGTIAERITVFREHHDPFRSAVVNEPRGSDVLVGALLCEPGDKSCVAAVIFFEHRIETAVGVVTTTLNQDGSVAVENVPSFRKAKNVAVEVPDLDGTPGTAHAVLPLTGDVAWGGNWFFLAEQHGQLLELTNVDRLAKVTWNIRQAVNTRGFPEVDHVELFGPPVNSWARSRNFVLCPGKAYDRSPCGTGTSAKLACLAADGKLDEGQPWVQESIIGSLFTARYLWLDRGAGTIVPTIIGTAFVTAESTLLLDESDPLCWGLRN